MLNVLQMEVEVTPVGSHVNYRYDRSVAEAVITGF